MLEYFLVDDTGKFYNDAEGFSSSFLNAQAYSEYEKKDKDKTIPPKSKWMTKLEVLDLIQTKQSIRLSKKTNRILFKRFGCLSVL